MRQKPSTLVIRSGENVLTSSTIPSYALAEAAAQAARKAAGVLAVAFRPSREAQAHAFFAHLMGV